MKISIDFERKPNTYTGAKEPSLKTKLNKLRKTVQGRTASALRNVADKLQETNK